MEPVAPPEIKPITTKAPLKRTELQVKIPKTPKKQIPKEAEPRKTLEYLATASLSSSPIVADTKDDEIAMGMSKDTQSKPLRPQEQSVKELKDLYSSEDPSGQKQIGDLLRQKDNPQAQLNAIIYLSNNYRNFNVRDETCINNLVSVDINSLSQTLGLSPEVLATMETKREELHRKFKRYDGIYKRREENSTERARFFLTERKSKLLHQLNNSLLKENQLEAEMYRLYREFMLPIRTAVLSSEIFPETYKLNVIEGIKGYTNPLAEEDLLLKNSFPLATERVKRQIADTVQYRLGHDLNSFDVLSMDDLQKYGVNLNEVFLATMGNAQTTGEFVETKVAPAFFPNEDPAKVRQSWEVLKKVTPRDMGYRGTSFFSDGDNRDTKAMNIKVFKNFMDNSKSLIPIVDMLSEYGFRYSPSDLLDGTFFQQYVDVLKDLGKDIVQLRSELDAIKSILPDYKYNYKVDTRYPPTKSGKEVFINNNPFAIAFKQNLDPYKWFNTPEELDKAIHLFESLRKVVPDRWKGGLISTYIDEMSGYIGRGYSDKSAVVTKRAISEANKYVFDHSMTPDQIELFATTFFEHSLDPKNENTEMVVEFCKKHADKIRTSYGGQKHVDADSTWHQLSLKASDLYRYPFVMGQENVAVAKAKTDVLYACEAVHKIKDIPMRDQSISNLIFPLTDEEIGDVEKAQIYCDMIRDDNLRSDAQIEINLEKERAQKGETTTWKKMEKVHRFTSANERYLKDLFGFSSEADFKQATADYFNRMHATPYFGEFDKEKQAQLEQETARIKDNFQVTVNITWANVVDILKTGRVLSAWENREVMENRNKYGSYNYEARRDQVERFLGNRAKGGMKDPHPLYGAASCPNGRDEFYGGSGGAYGECFITLKTDKIKDRTSFAYDDSFGIYNHWIVDWNGGISTKAIHNLNGHNYSRHGYVEAEILGGVSLEDIESINIPSDAMSGKNQYGWGSGADVLSQIDQLRIQHPGIKINVIQVPKT